MRGIGRRLAASSLLLLVFVLASACAKRQLPTANAAVVQPVQAVDRPLQEHPAGTASEQLLDAEPSSSADLSDVQSAGPWTLTDLCQTWCDQLEQLSQQPECDASTTACTVEVTKIARVMTTFIYDTGARLNIGEYSDLSRAIDTLTRTIDDYDFLRCTQSDNSDRDECQTNARAIKSAVGQVAQALEPPAAN